MALADEMLVCLNELEALKERRKYVLGHASTHVHLAICEMQRATADALLNERRREQADPPTERDPQPEVTP